MIALIRGFRWSTADLSTVTTADPVPLVNVAPAEEPPDVAAVANAGVRTANRPATLATGVGGVSGAKICNVTVRAG